MSGSICAEESERKVGPTHSLPISPLSRGSLQLGRRALPDRPVYDGTDEPVYFLICISSMNADPNSVLAFRDSRIGDWTGEITFSLQVSGQVARLTSEQRDDGRESNFLRSDPGRWKRREALRNRRQLRDCFGHKVGAKLLESK